MALVPIGFDFTRGSLEAGDFNFYARRGYAFVVMNVRGTGFSDGHFGNYDARSIQDIYEAIEWIARQPWCDGQVAMNGVSFFSIVDKRVAALKPPHLKTIFSPYGWTDAYRDRFYHGGILSYGLLTQWVGQHGGRMRIENDLRRAWGEEKYQAALAAANQGAVASYGADAGSQRLDEAFSRWFDREVRAFPVATGTAANATIAVNSAAAGSGTSYWIAGAISVPANASLIVVDKTTAVYLEEDKSILCTSGTSSTSSQ